MARKRSVPANQDGFGARLIALRRELRLAQVELGSKAKVSRCVISRIETRATPSTGTKVLFRLALVLGVRPDWLLRGNGQRALCDTERYLVELRASLGEISDASLSKAVATSRYRYHRSIVGVADAFARAGEHNTVAAWRHRLAEIARELSPLLTRVNIRARRKRTLTQ